VQGLDRALKDSVFLLAEGVDLPEILFTRLLADSASAFCLFSRARRTST
jgi:hypothetical protein